MYELPNTPDVISSFGSLLTAAAACCGVLIAYFGLTTWQSQALWHRDTELAKQLYLFFRLRKDRFENLRNPIMTGFEQEKALGRELKFDEDEETKDKAWIAAMQARYSALNDERIKMYPAEIEATAIWDNFVEMKSDELFQLEWTVFSNLRIMIQTRDRFSDQHENTEEYPNRHRIVFGGEGDTIKADYDRVFFEIEDWLKLKLRSEAK